MIADTIFPKRKFLNFLSVFIFSTLLLLSHNSFAISNCGKGIELDGVNDWVNIPDLVLANDFTIEGWFKLAPGIDYRDGLFGQEGSGPDIHFTSGKVRLYAYGIRVTAKTPILADTWEHIAITRSGANLKIYINGVEDSATGRWSGQLKIKAIGRGNRGYFKGMMDEIRIWNIARTGAEISSGFNTSVNQNMPGLIGYWNFNESDQVVTDMSNSGNHGSLGISSLIGADDPVRLDSLAIQSDLCEEEGGGNEAPLANDDVVGPVQIGETISFSVTDNDVDSDGNLDSTSVVVISAPNDGIATVDASGSITYQSTNSTATTDTLIYTVADLEGLVSNGATVSITVTEAVPPINTAPIANDDIIDPIEAGETINFSVTGNDVDSDGNLDTSSIIIVSGPNSGNTATVDTAGIITYINNGTTAYTDTIVYTVKDSEGLVSNEATVSITVTEASLPINIAPVAYDDTIDLVEIVSFFVTDNDVDSDGTINKSSLNIVSEPNYGSVVIDYITGEITYTHDGLSTFNDSFTYTVEDDLGEVSNEATVSITIASTSVSCGKGVELDGINDWINIPDLVLRNDFTIEGWFNLAPEINYKDGIFGQEGHGPDIHFVQGRVRLYVYGIRVTANTPLVAGTWGHVAITRSGTNLKVYINGVDDSVAGRWNGALSIKAIGRGNRGYFGGMMDEIRIWNVARTETEIAASYDTSIDPSSPGLVGYWNFNESDQVVTDNSSLVNHGSLGANTLIGSDDPIRLNSMAIQSELCEEEGPNEAPLANDDAVGPVQAGETISFSVTDNDVDNDGNLNSASVEIVSVPSDGVATVDELGIIHYQNTSLNETIDSLIYTVKDSQGLVSNEATVLITVTEPPVINVAPIAHGDMFGPVEAGGTISFSVTGNDVDSDGNLDPTRITIISGPNSGNTATVNATGLVTYINNGTTAITDTLVYIVEDTAGLVSNQAIVTITVTEAVPTNVAPVAQDDSVGPVVAGGTISFSVTENDADTNGNLDTTRITLISGPNSGNTATVDATGLVTYINNGTTAITDTLVYTVEDTAGLVSNQAVVTITVTEAVPTNVAPVAYDDSVGPVESGGAITFSVTENDVDSDGSINETSLIIMTGPSNGSIDIDSVTGEVTYIHDGSVSNSDSFTYKVKDDQGELSNQASVIITITNPSAQCGKGVELDGINDWVNIPDFSLTGDFTIESWIKLAPGIDNKDALFGQEGDGLDINFYQGKARLYAGGDRVTANTALLADTWGHLAIMRSGTSLTLYINGVEDATGTWNGVLSLKAIGRGNRGFLKGALDEVRIWNIARTETEISAHYNTSVNPDSLGLIGYWNFNGVDQIVTDTSGFDNHGSLGISSIEGTDDPVRLDSIVPFIESCDSVNPGENIAPFAYNDTVGPVQVGGSITFTVTANDIDSNDNLDPASVQIITGPSEGTVTVDAFGDITYMHNGSVTTADTLSYTVADTEGVISNIATVSLTISQSEDNLSLHGLFSDHAVLQRGVEVPVWGTAGTGNTVTVTFSGQTKTVVADIDGQWMVKLDPLVANAVGETLIVTSGQRTETRVDILVGEVWLASGQSNMALAMFVADPFNLPTSIPGSEEDPSLTPSIRLLAMNIGSTSDQVATDLSGGEKWKLSNRLGLNTFSAVAYYYGRVLNQMLDVPIGIITGTGGGTTIRRWIPESALQLDQCSESNSGINYNYSIAPLLPYAIKGVIWYQGESNTRAGKVDCYHDDLVTLIESWRAEWASAANIPSNDFPFYFVQLPNYEANENADYWVKIREHMLRVNLDTDRTEMVVSIDVGDANDAHPRKKLPIGERLAGIARALDYGENITYSGPVYNSIQMSGNTAILSFDHSGTGLISIDSLPLKYFEIAGENGIYHDAQAIISGDKIHVSSDSVLTPVKVRYAWLTNPENPNFANQEGLMATPFRTGATFWSDGGIPNTAPVANDDIVGPIEIGSSINFSVTGNDEDIDGNLNPTKVLIESEPSEGTVTINNLGVITYTHTGLSATTDTFSYTVADHEGVISNIANVSITISNNIAIPVANNDLVNPIQFEGSGTFNVLVNDTDADGVINSATLLIVSDPSSGSVVIDFSTGDITYTHDGSASTSDSFTYTVKDDEGNTSNEATVSISIINSTASCGNGIELDGNNDWVNIPDFALANDFTIESWVKLAPGIDNNDALFGQEGEGMDVNFYQAKVRLFAGGDRVTANTALSADTWGHIAITRSGTSLTLYVNGVEDATGTWNGTLSLEALGRGNRGFLKGMMDEVRIWNIARTGTEINTYYNTDVDPNSLGLVGYWTFNEIDQLINDVSNSGNHASLGISTANGSDDPVVLISEALIYETCLGNIPNVPPIANDDSFGSIELGETISFTVTSNDTDINGNLDLSNVAIAVDPNFGTATVDVFGRITYIHTGTEAIIDTLKYTVADTEGLISNEATVMITVAELSATNFEVMQSFIFDANKPSNEEFLSNYNMRHLPELGSGKINYWDVEGGENPYYDYPNELIVKETANTATSDTVFIDLEHLPTNFRDQWDHDGNHLTPTISITDSDRDRSIAELTSIADWVHESDPNLVIGYYGILPIREYWSFINPVLSADLEKLLQANDKFISLANHVDIIFPSIYTFYNDRENWKIFARGMIVEAKKYNKPIYAFIWPQYHPGTSFIDGEFWRIQLEELYALGIDGVVIWGGYLQIWDVSALDNDPNNWWYQTLDFMNSKGLLPANSTWSPNN